MRLLSHTTTKTCTNHWCEECTTKGMHPCALFEGSLGEKQHMPEFSGYCHNLDMDERNLVSDANLQLMHFAYKSTREWDKKKARGRFASSKIRKGDVTPEYDSIFDDRLAKSTKKRLGRLENREPATCLASSLLGADKNQCNKIESESRRSIIWFLTYSKLKYRLTLSAIFD